MILFPSNSSCSHQQPIKFPLFPTTSHQRPFVPNAKPTQSSKLCERLGQRAKRSAAVPGQAGRGATVAGRRRLQQSRKVEIFCLARFCGRSRADLLLARQSAALLPSCAWARDGKLVTLTLSWKPSRTRGREIEIESW
jgi:hypothetical protein